MKLTRGRLSVGLFASALAVAAIPVGGGSAAAVSDQYGANGSATTAASGSMQENGLTVYKYLRAQGFTPMAAAGATTSMAGESSWNPESWEMDSNGLMSGGIMQLNGLNYSACTGKAEPTGDPTADLDTQLPAIFTYLSKEVTGAQQYIDQMAGAPTIMDASQIWSDSIERAGVSDAHQANAVTVAGFARQVDGVNLNPGA